MPTGGLGNIGSAFVTVELDFDNAVREAKTAGAKVPPVELRVDIDQSQANTEIRTTVATASKGIPPISPKVIPNTAQATSAIRATMLKASATAGQFFVRVNSASLEAAATRVRTVMAGAMASAGRIGSAALFPLALAVGVIGVELKKGNDDAKKFSQTMTEVAQAVRLFGKSTGVTADQISEVAGEFKNLTSITGGSIKSAEASLLKFGVVTNKTLKPMTGLLLDTAVGMRQVGEDGKLSAGFATKFGRALLDPTKGLALLAKGGVPVTAELKATVKEMQKAGKTAQATALVTDLLRNKFRGAAKGFGTSIGAQLRVAGFAFEEARRDLAVRILPSIVPIIAQVGGEIAASLKKNEKPIAKFVTGFVKSAGAVIRFVTTSKDFHRVVGGIARIVSGIARGLKGFAKNFAAAFSQAGTKKTQTFGETMQRIGTVLGEFAAKWIPRIGTALGTLAGWITRSNVLFAGFIAILTSAKFLGIRATFTILIDVVVAVGSAFVAVFGAIPVAIGAVIAVAVILYAKFRIVRRVMNTVIGVFVAMLLPIAAVGASLVALWKKSERFRNIVKGALGAVGKAFGGLKAGASVWKTGMGVILDASKSKFQTWKNGVSIILEQTKTKLRGFRTAMRSILDSDLFKLGRKIILSLWNGMKDAWKDVAGWLGERAAIIKHLKGPMSVDRRLLFDEGSAIMGSLFRGLKRRWTGIASWLSGVGQYFKGVIGAGDIDVGKILLGEADASNLNKQLGGLLDVPFTAGFGGFLHPTSGWPDTLAQLNILGRMFGTSLSSGLRSFDTVPGAGISQHTLGQAGDEVGSNAALTNLARFTSRLPGIFKQVIWLNRLWSGGFPTNEFIPNHMDHVHLGWQPRAAGGQVSKGRQYKWNERGSEMFVPHGNGYVMNAGRTKELVSALRDLSKRPASNRSSNAEIHVHSNASDPVAVGGIVMSNLGAVFSRA